MKMPPTKYPAQAQGSVQEMDLQKMLKYLQQIDDKRKHEKEVNVRERQKEEEASEERTI